MAATDYDTIVIGSGAGGLTAALCLAQAGQKVLVLEQHYVPGGWCQTFQLEGHRFSPGVHYIGELGPGGRMRRIFEGLGVAGDLPFLELNPDGYDHVRVGTERFDIPRGKDRLADRLKSRFPREAKGIDSYLDKVDRMAGELAATMSLEPSPHRREKPFFLAAPTVLRYGLRSLDSLFGACSISDPLLKAILGSQSGDHGLAPARIPAALHASVVAHYFDGGYYPRGGGFQIPRALVRGLKRAGGELRVRVSVACILLESGRAIGVRLADGTALRADSVISNADPGVTFGRLVGREHLGWRLRRKLARTRYSASALSLFLAVDLDARAAGLDSGNYWSFEHPDLNAIYDLARQTRATELEEIPGLFLTVTTLKDPSKKKNHHTMEAFTFVSHDSFRAWAAAPVDDRSEGYQAMKRVLMDRMVRAAGKVVPGLEERIVFSELGTPLTNTHYVGATRGNLYGTEKSLWQVGPFGWPIETEIHGLRMCGASTLGHGVLAAMRSGMAAAASVLHCPAAELLRAHVPEISLYPSEDPSVWPAHLRPRPSPQRSSSRDGVMYLSRRAHE